MDTINTIITNAQTLANANIDWSPAAGPIWLVALVVICAISGAITAWRESRR